MRSIERHLGTVLFGVGVASIACFGAVTYLLVARTLTARFDLALRAKATSLGTLLGIHGGEVELDFAGEVMPEFEGGADPEYFCVWLNDGTVLERSDTLGERDLERRFGPTEAPAYWNGPLPDGRPGRSVGVRVIVDGPDDPSSPEDVHLAAPSAHAVVVVSHSREDLDRTLAAILSALAGAGAIVGITIAFAGRRAVRRGIRPLREFARRVGEIEAQRLAQRVPSADLPVEFAPIAEGVNALLERLDGAFAKERRLTASVAHEVRTPLAEIRSATELAIRWPEDPALRRHAIETAHGASVELATTVEALLRLARLQSSAPALRTEGVAIGAAFDAAWASARPTAQERGLTLDRVDPDRLAVEADPDLLRLALRNLVENAVLNARPGSTVGFRATRAGSAIEITLSNDAPSLAAEDLDRLAEPFWRKDASRTSRNHVGLGLTLCRAALDALGGRLAFRLASGRLEARILLAPARADAPPASDAASSPAR